MKEHFVQKQAMKKILEVIDILKVGPRHIHVTSDVNDLPVGAIIPAAWGNVGEDGSIVFDATGNAWLQCNGQSFNPADYPDLVGLVNGTNVPDLDPFHGQPLYIKATDFRVFPIYPIGWLKVLSAIDPVIFAHYGEWLRCDGRGVSLEEYPDLLNLGGVTDPHEAFVDVVGPMVSNSGPTANLSASSMFSEHYDAHRAFGRSERPSTHDAWITGRNTFDTDTGESVSPTGEFIEIEFPEPTSLTRYSFRSRNLPVTAGESTARNVRLQASEDGTNWVNIDQRTNLSAAILPYQMFNFGLVPTVPYKYWRFAVTRINLGAMSRAHVGISEVYLWRLDNIPAMINLPDIPLNRGRYTYIKAKRTRHIEQV